MAGCLVPLLAMLLHCCGLLSDHRCLGLLAEAALTPSQAPARRSSVEPIHPMAMPVILTTDEEAASVRVRRNNPILRWLARTSFCLAIIAFAVTSLSGAFVLAASTL
jgi:hypothetical protein